MLTLEESLMIKVLYRKGVSISEIAGRTGRDRNTIRHIATMPLTESSPAARQARARNIHPYIPYLTQRIEEGVLNARKLYGVLRGILGERARCASGYIPFVRHVNQQRQCALKRHLASKGKWTGATSEPLCIKDGAVGSTASL